MNQKREIAFEIIKTLPEATLKRLRLGDLALITGAVSVKERIEAFYRIIYSHQKELSQFKFSRGYCAGRPNCMAFVGKDSKHKTCAACRKYLADMRKRAEAGETRPSVPSEYGIIRARERKELKKRVA